MLFHLISILLLLAFCTRCSSVIKATAFWLFCAWKLVYYVYRVTQQNLFQILLLFYHEIIPIKNTLLCSVLPKLHYCFSLNIVLSLHVPDVVDEDGWHRFNAIFLIWYLHILGSLTAIKVGSHNTTLSTWAHCLHVHKQKERRPVPDERNNRYLPSRHNQRKTNTW